MELKVLSSSHFRLLILALTFCTTERSHDPWLHSKLHMERLLCSPFPSSAPLHRSVLYHMINVQDPIYDVLCQVHHIDNLWGSEHNTPINMIWPATNLLGTTTFLYFQQVTDRPGLL